MLHWLFVACYMINFRTSIQILVIIYWHFLYIKQNFGWIWIFSKKWLVKKPLDHLPAEKQFSLGLEQGANLTVYELIIEIYQHWFG